MTPMTATPAERAAAAHHALTAALADALTAVQTWFAAHPAGTRVADPHGTELRYAPESELRYLDAEGFTFESGDEHLDESHPYWLLDGEDLLTCLDLLMAADAA